MEELPSLPARIVRAISGLVCGHRRRLRRQFIESLEDRTLLSATVVKTDPSLASGLIATGTERISVEFSDPVSVPSPGDVQLQSVGADGLLGTADDEVADVTATRTSPHEVSVLFAPLAQQIYRLTIFDYVADFVTTPAAATSEVSLVSGNPSAPGEPGDSSSTQVSVSGDGQFIVFRSSATNMVDGDTDQYSDIFIQNRSTRHIERVSLSADDEAANWHSYAPDISDDAELVVFESGATNLVAEDDNGFTDIFVRNRTTDATSLVTVNRLGTRSNADSFDAAISGDGRFVAFESTASNLVEDDENNNFDIFVKDLITGRIVRASTDLLGRESNGNSYAASVSHDGRFVAFVSTASNLVPGDTNERTDVFLKDMITGSIRRMTTDNRFREANGDSYAPSVSGDGRFVAFHSFASNLVEDDVNGVADVFVKELASGAIVRASLDSHGGEANGGSYRPQLSHDGRTATFYSYASNLVAEDTQANADIFVRYVGSGETALVSPISPLPDTDGTFYTPTISADGQFVAFRGNAPGLHEDVGPLSQIYGASLTEELSQTVLPMALGELVSLDPDGFGAGQVLYGSEGFAHGLNRLQIDGVDYAPSAPPGSTDSGQSITTAAVFLSDLNVSRKITIPNFGEHNFIRTVETLENPDSEDKQVVVRLVGNLGSDFATSVFATSDGDTRVENFDQWIGTDDEDNANSPATVHYVRGPGDVTPNDIRIAGDNIAWEYHLTIPAFETVRLATFTIIDDSRMNAVSAASELIGPSGFGGAAAAFMTNAEVESLANYSFVSDFGDAPDTYGTTLAKNGARHSLSGDLFLGVEPPDGEIDGFANGTDEFGSALDDDHDGRPDEDGLLTNAELQLEIGETPQVRLSATNQTGSQATLIGWIDFDGDGVFSDSEAAYTTVADQVDAASFTLNFRRITGDFTGSTYARFRLTTDPGIDWRTPGGLALDGEVEDHQVTISLPSVSLSISHTVGYESDETLVTITATSSQPVVEDQTVQILETGPEREDYAFVGRQISIPVNHTSGVTTFSVIDDQIVEATETMSVRIISVSDGLQPADASSQTIQIVDDDEALLSIRDVTRPEGDSGTTDFTFEVTLDSEVDSDVSVDFSTIAGTAIVGTDYVADLQDTLTFPAGSKAGSTQSFAVKVIADEFVEPANVFFADLSNVVAPGRKVTLGNTRGTGTIWNDDRSEVNVGVSFIALAEDSGGTLTYTFTRDRTVAETPDLTVWFDIEGTATGADYITDFAESVTFAAGSSTASITATLISESIVEADETIVVKVRSGSGYQIGDTSEVTATILNDDFSTVSVAAVQDSVREDDESLASITFTRTNVSSETPSLLVEFDTSGNATSNDFALSPTDSIRFEAGATTATLLLDPISDNIVEPDETVFVTIKKSDDYHIAAGSTAIEILNDDTSTITLSPIRASASEGDGGSSDYSFRVVLDNPVDQGFRLGYSTDNVTAIANDDYEDNDGTLLFDGFAAEEKVITVGVFGDETVEQTETFAVVLGEIQGLRQDISLDDITFANTEFTATIRNDDIATLTIDDVREFEGDDGTTDFLFAVTLSAPVDTAVSFLADTSDITAEAGIDYVGVEQRTTVIVPGTTTATIAVGVNGDEIPEFQEEFAVLLSALDADGRDVSFADSQALGTIPREDVGLFVDAGELFVFGSDVSDSIVVRETETQIEVELNGVPLSSVPTTDVSQILVQAFAGSDTIDIQLIGSTRLFAHGGSDNDNIAIQHIGTSTLQGGSGNDTIAGGAGPNEIYGATGDDWLKGNNADDILLGGFGDDLLQGAQGNDVMIGGAGNDKIVGSTGRDVLIGGLGIDDLRGGAGSDLLIGSGADWDADISTLAAIQIEWSSSADAADRVQTLRAGWMPLATIVNDFEPDTLATGSGDEWAIRGLNDTLKDTPEFLDEI